MLADFHRLPEKLWSYGAIILTLFNKIFSKKILKTLKLFYDLIEASSKLSKMKISMKTVRMFLQVICLQVKVICYTFS